ncbi:hypothetical protein [Ensifer aridi]|uniref:hypothetical protein n=1 Tax=Ensifer aridi TaxID=1708715 RepID=UPI000A11AD8F|nr:hypothetical protein [Ensifer aridi]
MYAHIEFDPGQYRIAPRGGDKDLIKIDYTMPMTAEGLAGQIEQARLHLDFMAAIGVDVSSEIAIHFVKEGGFSHRLDRKDMFVLMDALDGGRKHEVLAAKMRSLDVRHILDWCRKIVSNYVRADEDFENHVVRLGPDVEDWMVGIDRRLIEEMELHDSDAVTVLR